MIPSLTDRQIMWAVALLTLLTLGLAHGSEVFFHLRPCLLCQYQRWVSGGIVGIAFLSLMVGGAHVLRGAVWVCAFLLLINGGIAFFQVLVEHHIVPPPGACRTVALSGSIEDIRRQLLAVPPVPCDRVQASFLGLSMAAYHSLYCFGLGILTTLAAVQRKRGGVR